MNPLLTLGLTEDPRSLKRFITGALGVLAIAGHNHLGLNLTEHQMDLMAGIIVSMVLGSNYLDAARAKAKAEAAKVATSEDADAVILRKPPPALLITFVLTGLTLLWSSPVHAEGPADAPKLVSLKKDQPAPFDGRLYSVELHLDTAKRLTTCETTLKEVEPHVGTKWWIPVVVGVGALALGAGVGYGVATLARPPMASP